MPLAGAAAAAATAWMTQPAGGKLCADIARVPILAGAIAAGLDVTVMESISVDSPTYDQDVRDFCDDCAVRVKSVQNIFRDWHRTLKTGAGTLERSTWLARLICSCVLAWREARRRTRPRLA